MTELKEKLKRIRAVRRGNRGVIAKLINEAEECLEEEIVPQGRLKTITGLLEEKLTFVKELDQRIIEICKVDEIVNEIEGKQNMKFLLACLCEEEEWKT